MMANPLAPRRRLVLALVLSLTLNLFLIGLGIGWAVTGGGIGGDERRSRGGVFFELRGYAEALPEEHRGVIRERLRDAAPDMRPSWQRLRELRGEIARLIAAPDPDRAAIDARLTEVRDLTTTLQTHVQRHAFDALLDLPPEVRTGLDVDAGRERRER